MKAVVMGGARGVSVPDNDFGWGCVDLEETLFPSNRAVKLVDRIPFAEGEVFTYVVETTNAAPLDVQLVWIDYPGSEEGDQSEPRLVNDLDLFVKAVDDGGWFCGNGGTTADTLNTVESVRLGTATPGRYVITVACRSILFDHTEGGAAALYVRGAFDPSSEAESVGSRRVRIRETGAEFFWLDDALTNVTDEANTIEVQHPTELRATGPYTFSSTCTITTTNASPETTPVVLCGANALAVAPGATVTLSNVVFAYDGELDIDVARGGNFVWGPGTDLGGDYSLKLTVVDGDGFTLAGAITNWTALAGWNADGPPFGHYICPSNVAARAADFIYKASDNFHATRGVARMFEDSTNLIDWTKEMTVTPLGTDTEWSSEFEVAPSCEPPQPKAFIRLSY